MSICFRLKDVFVQQKYMDFLIQYFCICHDILMDFSFLPLSYPEALRALINFAEIFWTILLTTYFY